MAAFRECGITVFPPTHSSTTFLSPVPRNYTKRNWECQTPVSWNLLWTLIECVCGREGGRREVQETCMAKPPERPVCIIQSLVELQYWVSPYNAVLSSACDTCQGQPNSVLQHLHSFLRIKTANEYATEYPFSRMNHERRVEWHQGVICTKSTLHPIAETQTTQLINGGVMFKKSSRWGSLPVNKQLARPSHGGAGAAIV